MTKLSLDVTIGLARRKADRGGKIRAGLEWKEREENIMMNVNEFIEKLELAVNSKTLYVMGCFGAPMNAKNKTRYTNNHSYNKGASRTAMINAASEDTFGFDCVCLIKGVLWGWNADKTRVYGGAAYKSNDVPDIAADSIITKCSEISTDFSTIQRGELVWMKGHVGVYVGDGKVIECTPAWENKVQITGLSNSPFKSSLSHKRSWTKHGKLPYVDYSSNEQNRIGEGGGSVHPEETGLTKEPVSVGGSVNSEQTSAPVVPKEPDTNELKLFKFLVEAGYTEIAAAGIMGNIYCESGFRPNNLQNTYEKKLGLTDDQYTAKVNSGEMTLDQFQSDAAGYGLAQWTYWSRKKKLYEYIMPKYKDISSLTGQGEFLVREIGSYGLNGSLNACKTVREASDIIMKKYEQPANQGEEASVKRATAGEKSLTAWRQYLDKQKEASESSEVTDVYGVLVDKAVSDMLSDLGIVCVQNEPHVSEFKGWIKRILSMK